MSIFILIILCTNPFETEDTRDLEAIVKDLEYLQLHQVDISTADVEDLMKIPYLTITDCLKLISYREKHGPFDSIDDLFRIVGLDPLTIRCIKPYIVVKTKSFKIGKLTQRTRFKRTLSKMRSEEYYTRTQAVFNDYHVFLVTEKDPYENSFFDYYAGGILIDEGKRKFCLGKYDLDLGSGVILSSVGSIFQSADFRIMTNERGIMSYTSTLENRGFFGTALTDSMLLNYTIFYSNQNLDGRVDTLGYAHSFDETGDHIDSVSNSHKDRIREEIIGYDIKYQLPNIVVASRSYLCKYEPAFVCEDSLTQFYGSGFWMSGLSAKHYGNDFVLFAEIARAHRNRLGGLFGFGGIFPYNVGFNLAGKYFPTGFFSPKGVEANEDYFGLTIDLNHNSKIASFGTNLNISNRTEEDSSRYDLRLNFEKAIGIISSKLQARWRFAENSLDMSGFKAFLRLSPVDLLYLDLRLEEKYAYVDTLQKGIFGSLELGVKFWKAEVKTRYGLFNTDSYSTRMIVYEPDLPGVISNRILYDKGQYGIVFLSLKPVGYINLSVKYSAMDKDSLTQQISTQIDLKL